MDHCRFSTFTSLVLYLLFSHLLGALSSDIQIYIVNVRRPESITSDANPSALEDYYRSFLPKNKNVDAENISDQSRLVYSYEQSFSGFAARLTAEEVKAMEMKEGFLHAYPDPIIPLATTHTPAYLGLQLGSGLWQEGTNLGEGIVIGVLDSGVMPSHPSFDDSDMPPPPPTWKGACEVSNFCNKKIIGARSFMGGPSPLDDDGHGSHTAATAAGAFVGGANFLGEDSGTTAGIAPRAHLAIYKICGPFGCPGSNILAGLDAAIKDGVDVVSLSLGGGSTNFHEDPLAVGTLAAIEKGIVPSVATGNSGPSPSTAGNLAPWILTVGASSIDREIRSTVRLPDGRAFRGQVLNQPKNFTKDPLPLVHGGFCNTTDQISDVRGKLVLCDGSLDGDLVISQGAAGVIYANSERVGETISAELYPLPASHVGHLAGTEIYAYIIASGGKATASLQFEGTVTGESTAPAVAFFSSRGPNNLAPYIIKPDIVGPGVSILAAWNSNPLGSSNSSYYFNVISGTSMAAPHLSGIAALLKKAHPDWSPAAIKSAILTTSDVLGNDGKPIKNERLEPASFHQMGAGHVNPSRAADPGLVYELGSNDYARFLCGLDLTDEQVSTAMRRDVACKDVGRIQQWDLNYPTISVALSGGGQSVVVNRTVTNVGSPGDSYKVEVDEVSGIEVDVTPTTLAFGGVKEAKSYTVKFTRTGGGGDAVEGNLRWVSGGGRVVRSPFHVDLR